MNIGILILKSGYFALPAYVANMTPTLIARWKVCEKLAVPIDFNKRFNKKPILGKNKTYRGLIFGTIAAIIITLIQMKLYSINSLRSISLFDYSSVRSVVLLGFLLGFGALFGDIVKSFFKRRLGKKEGTHWPVFDQIDYIIGALIFSRIIFEIPVNITICLLIMSPLLHIISNIIGYHLKIKKVWW